jgi:hypothetical protein
MPMQYLEKLNSQQSRAVALVEQAHAQFCLFVTSNPIKNFAPFFKVVGKRKII